MEQNLIEKLLLTDKVKDCNEIIKKIVYLKNNFIDYNIMRRNSVNYFKKYLTTELLVE